MDQFIKYVGLATHKDTIAVAIADASGGQPRFYGEIANTARHFQNYSKISARSGTGGDTGPDPCRGGYEAP